MAVVDIGDAFSNIFLPSSPTGQCDAALGMQSGAIPDEHISASSYFDNAVNAIYGR